MVNTLTPPRLDNWLKQKYPDYSRNYFQYLIEKGAVLVNGSVAKKKALITEDDEVDVQFLLTEEISLEAENIPLDILYEDSEIIVVNKPPGMVVHPAPGSPNGTFVNALLYHCKNLSKGENLRPGIVHRLDKGTSGVLIAAKTDKAHSDLSNQFAMREVEKNYLAITAGTPPIGMIEHPIGRHPVHRKEMTILAEGKEAKTEIISVEKGPSFAAVSIKLHTGRTHQIRVHLRAVNALILGDDVYGKPHASLSRPMLHAERLTISHPVSGERLTFSAPLPHDMQNLIDQISVYQVK